MDQTSDAGAEIVVEAEVGRMVDSRGTRGVVGPFGGGHVEAALVMFSSSGQQIYMAFWTVGLCKCSCC